MSEMSEMSEKCETWYRVPRSAEECAVHLEAGGVVEFCFKGEWRNPGHDPDIFRVGLHAKPLDLWRLVYSTPVGMSPVIGAPGHAYGLTQQAPEGWTMHSVALSSWQPGGCHPEQLIEARPPAPAPEPRTEKVPLTKLAGRTLVGETERVGRLNPPYGAATRTYGAATWRWRPEWSTLWRLLTVDVETGMVEVLAEEEA